MPEGPRPCPVAQEFYGALTAKADHGTQRAFGSHGLPSCLNLSLLVGIAVASSLNPPSLFAVRIRGLGPELKIQLRYSQRAEGVFSQPFRASYYLRRTVRDEIVLPALQACDHRASEDLETELSDEYLGDALNGQLVCPRCDLI